MTERVKKTLDFLTEQFEVPQYFREEPAQKNYRLEHSLRVANLCAEIARAEGMDEEALTVAGLLHDVGYGADFPPDYDWKNHGRDGARMARPFLETLGLPAETVEDICFAIAIHVDDEAGFPGRRTPFAETVGDADNIDRFDAWRIYESVRYQAGLEEKSLPEKLEWIRNRLSGLKKLGEMRLATPTANALWQDKLEFQTLYFTRLLDQMGKSCLSDEQEVVNR